MNTVQIKLADEQADWVKQQADKRGESAEAWVERFVTEAIARHAAFDQAANYVLDKNRELHRRLA